MSRKSSVSEVDQKHTDKLVIYLKNLNSVNIYTHWYVTGNNPDDHIYGGNGCSGTIIEIDTSALPHGGGNAGSSHIAEYGQPT